MACPASIAKKAIEAAVIFAVMVCNFNFGRGGLALRFILGGRRVYFVAVELVNT